MSRKNRKLNWWLPFLLIPGMVVLLVVTPQLFRSQLVGEIADIAIIVATFGMMLAWVRANESALLREEEQDLSRSLKIRVFEPRSAEGQEESAAPSEDDTNSLALALSPVSLTDSRFWHGGSTRPTQKPRNN